MKKIVLTGGGTAGHVTPNIALLPKLRELGYEIHYIGKVYRFIGKSALSAIPYKPNRLSQGVGSKKQLTQSSSCKRCKVGYDAFRME